MCDGAMLRDVSNHPKNQPASTLGYQQMAGDQPPRRRRHLPCGRGAGRPGRAEKTSRAGAAHRSAVLGPRRPEVVTVHAKNFVGTVADTDDVARRLLRPAVADVKDLGLHE